MKEHTQRRQRIFFLTVHRNNRSPSQRFRFEQYIPILKAQGYICIQSFLVNEKDDLIMYLPGHYWGKFRILVKSILLRLYDLIRIRKNDIVFVQRESIMIGTAFFEKRLARKANLIYDLDDAIWLSGVSRGNEKLAWLKGSVKVPEIMQCAKKVIAGNQYLADYARQYNADVSIIPTTIDTDTYYLRKPKEFSAPFCIGWTGSFSTIPHFEVIIPVLRKLKESYQDNVYFKVIGDEHFVNEALGIRGEKWEPENEVEKLAEIDIGIMPLPDDEWTRGKCALKGLQYMSLGIPTIMSPVGVNSEVIVHGENGFLAGDPEEWYDLISFWMDHPSKMNEMGQKGRETVLKKYSVEANQSLYLQIMKDAAKQ